MAGVALLSLMEGHLGSCDFPPSCSTACIMYYCSPLEMVGHDSPLSTKTIVELWAFRVICPTWGGARGCPKGWEDLLLPPWASLMLKIGGHSANNVFFLLRLVLLALLFHPP